MPLSIVLRNILIPVRMSAASDIICGILG
jgi:hypothetical protein